MRIITSGNGVIISRTYYYIQKAGWRQLVLYQGKVHISVSNYSWDYYRGSVESTINVYSDEARTEQWGIKILGDIHTLRLGVVRKEEYDTYILPNSVMLENVGEGYWFWVLNEHHAKEMIENGAFDFV